MLMASPDVSSMLLDHADSKRQAAITPLVERPVCAYEMILGQRLAMRRFVISLDVPYCLLLSGAL